MATSVPKILVVEHEQIAVADLERNLTSLGYRVGRVAATGNEAVKVMGEFFPDLVLINLQLQGGLDGLATAGEIRRRRQVPVIYTTADANDERCGRARSNGPFGLLVKPFGTHQLYATISMALHQQELLRQETESRNLLSAILKSTQDGVIATDAAGKVRFVSSAAEKITGWQKMEAAGKFIEDVYPLLDSDRQPLRQHLVRRALDTGVAQEKRRLVLVCRDGREVLVEDAAVPLRDAQGEISGALTVFCDITERIRMEQFQMEERERLEEALDTTRAELRGVIGRGITVMEEERRRVARELHDDLGQRIAFLQFEAERMQQYALAPEVHAGLRRFAEEAAKFSSALRDLSHRLHPSILEDLGLLAALRSLVEDYRRQGLDVTLSAGELSGLESLDVRTNVYRITQEALRNTWKHAPGAAVHVRLLEENRHLQLTIEDTGPGFDVGRARAEGGLGLLSMQERARFVGGSLLLSSHPDGGTTLAVRVPLSPQA